MTVSSGSALQASPNSSPTTDDDIVSELDEPPEREISFAKRMTPCPPTSNHDHGLMSPGAAFSRNESLLTQALLSSPEMNPMSDAEAPVLTSDGGMTSPARTTTPSPPPPATGHMDLGILISNKLSPPIADRPLDISQINQVQAPNINSSQESKVEEGLGRRRCISFACGRQRAPQQSFKSPKPPQDQPPKTLKSAEPPNKRPCMLRFACPMKPSRPNHDEAPASHSQSADPQPVATEAPNNETTEASQGSEHGDSTSSIENSKSGNGGRAVHSFNRVDFQKSEATRFHEFAGGLADDEWTNEQTAYRQKLTVNDTLRKENAIRQLAKEAEEEGLDEDDEDTFEGNSQEDQDEDNEEEEGIFDDGNESDDEEGFADSDDESEVGSDYQFWTTGRTTAATSTEHVDHVRLATRRVASDSSFESSTHLPKQGSARRAKGPRGHKMIRMRPGTPDLPDSTDFVIGTLDEDRPLEEAYKSCLEERRRSKQPMIPQDIDPSFPTSDPEADDDDEIDEEDEEDETTQLEGDDQWVTGRPDTSEDEELQARRKSSSSTRATKSPMPSPRRLHSPPPKRKPIYRSSPPPRRLFGQTTHRLRSPPPIHRRITSPPSSRRPSTNGSPSARSHGIIVPHLAQRPNLTHTTSLPKTPNPFWNQHRMAQRRAAETPSAGTSPGTVKPPRLETHTRGPIDIVQGLETKRQRRKDKFWRQHCRDASKFNKQRCQPGKGAERMKELGEMMSERCRGYGYAQKADLVLSV